MAQQHRRDHRHHAQRKRAHHAASHPHHDGGGDEGPEPGGPLMMTQNRGLMAVITAILVLGLIAFGVVWALAWT
jgi:hypothetical protein